MTFRAINIDREHPNSIRDNEQTQERVFARPLAKAGQVTEYNEYQEYSTNSLRISTT